MRAMSLFLLLYTMCPQPTLGVINGNKLSMMKAPWIVYGEGYREEKLRKFAGTIIHAQLVLTVSIVPNEYINIKVIAGKAKIDEPGGQERTIKSAQINEFVAILEVNKPFLFGPNVQRGSMALFKLRLGKVDLYMTAGWGQVNWYNTQPKELHMTVHYATSTGLNKTDRDKRFLMHYRRGRNLALGKEDLGAPIWDPFTGEVVGMAWDWVQFKYPINPDILVRHAGINIGYYIQWIQETKLRMLNIRPS